MNQKDPAPDGWRRIWEKKGTQEVPGTGLDRLLAYAGFDSATGRISVDEYKYYVETICSKVHLRKSDRVLEVGCGVGAFLNCLKPSPAEMVGVDYSQSIISRAKTFENNAGIRFYQGEAGSLSLLGIGLFDVIFSNSVFFYLPSLDYAARVCEQIVKSLRKHGRIAILDVNDERKKEMFLKLRYSEVGEKRYRELYEGLDQLFYDRSFFVETFDSLGCTHIRIEEQCWRGSKNSAYRFNVFVQKQ